MVISSDSLPWTFSDEVALAAARWVAKVDSAATPEGWRPEFEAWLEADPEHRSAFRAMTIAACFWKAARLEATAADQRELEIAILGHSLTCGADAD